MARVRRQEVVEELEPKHLLSEAQLPRGPRVEVRLGEMDLLLREEVRLEERELGKRRLVRAARVRLGEEDLRSVRVEEGRHKMRRRRLTGSVGGSEPGAGVRDEQPAGVSDVVLKTEASYTWSNKKRSNRRFASSAIERSSSLDKEYRPKLTHRTFIDLRLGKPGLRSTKAYTYSDKA